MSAIVTTPPLRRFKPAGAISPTIFIGGSIEMGAARDWQAEAITALTDYASVIYNPRRPDWDASWEQSITNPEFNAQVTWEMDAIDRADLVLLHFEPETKSPITLGEAYWCLATKPLRTIVSCPEGFWRRGNVEIMCERAGGRFFGELDAALSRTQKLANALKRRGLAQGVRLD